MLHEVARQLEPIKNYLTPRQAFVDSVACVKRERERQNSYSYDRVARV